MIGFVVGHPRSGTQLVSALLNAAASPRVSAHELLFRLSPRSVAEATRYYRGSVGGALIDGLLSRYDRQRVAIDCNWKLTWILPPLLARYPRARVLHLVRHPRENVASCHDLDYYGELASSGRLPRERFRDYWLRWMPAVRRADWDALSRFERNCAFWDESHRLIEAHAGGAAAYCRMHLEDLARGECAALFDFFSVAPPPPELLAALCGTRFNTKEQEKQQVVEAGGEALAGLERWPPGQVAALERLCGARAARLGYRIQS